MAHQLYAVEFKDQTEYLYCGYIQ